MGFWDDWHDLLPGLLPASYRGVRFHIVDSDHEVGRRVLLTYFPGIDQPAADDFGRLDGPIDVRGLMVGDDYVAQAMALQTAFQTPGVATLVHPWLGERRVLMERPGRIRFSDTELRVAWFDATFTPVELSRAPILSTASLLQSAAGSLVSAASAYAGGALGGAMAVATFAQAQSAAGTIADLVASRVAAAPEGAELTPLVAPAVERLRSVISGAAV